MQHRDEVWLSERVRLLWDVHFRDVPVGLPIVVRFGTRARYRFGSIAARSDRTVILVNRLFSDPIVPDYVVDATLAHELAHYAHGFGSGLPKLHQHAHRGGIVERELEVRGLGEVTAKAEAWRERNWQAVYAANCGDVTARKVDRAQLSAQKWDAFLARSNRRTTGSLVSRLEHLAPRFGYVQKPPFGVAWLHASRRQTGLSYWFARDRVVRVHGLLADQHVPDNVLDCELAYWLARVAAGTDGDAIRDALLAARLGPAADEAFRWRTRAWASFLRRYHPLG